MVGPVRAVAWPSPGIYCTLHVPRFESRLAWPRWLRLSAGWDQLSCAEGKRGGPSHPRFDPYAFYKTIPSAFLKRWDCPPKLAKVQPSSLWSDRASAGLQQVMDGRDPATQWQPWPTEPPLTDRVEIRWPSDNWPPAEAPAVVEDQVPDASVQVIMWRETGSLLDMWA